MFGTSNVSRESNPPGGSHPVLLVDLRDPIPINWSTMITFARVLVPAAAATVALSGSAFAQVPNDDCSGAIAIGNGQTVGSNIGATNSVPTGSCQTMGSDVWYEYTADCDGIALATFCQGGGAADFDPVLVVYDGACGSLVEIACNDDSCGLLSEVGFPVNTGESYFIAVGGFTNTSGVSSEGNFTLDLSCGPITDDDCLGAVPITEGLTSSSNIGYTTGPTVGSCASMGSDVWYEYTASGSGTLLVSFCQPGTSASFDTALAAFTGPCTNLTQVACNDDSCALLSEISFAVTAGQTYYIAVGGYNGDQGTFSVGLRCPGCSTPSTEVVRLGSPPNPDAFLPGVTSGPVTGQTWDPTVDHTTFVPSSLADFMIISGLSINSDLGVPLGTLLVDPLSSFFKVVVTTPGTPFSFPIPDVPAFVGVQLFTQAGSIDQVFQGHLTNALDLTIGDV